MAKIELINSFLLLFAATLLDLLIGDPKKLTHPVQVIGYFINFLKIRIESLARNKPNRLKVGGVILTALVIFMSGTFAFLIEKITFTNVSRISLINYSILIICLSSSLAAGSLRKSVFDVINSFKEKNEQTTLSSARLNLSKIVGREVRDLNSNEILRAAAETASENAIDGIFAPLFWIFIGTISWNISLYLPGPLTMVWIYKASSTIDSMIGYKKGNLKWLGWSGAKLDDILTWIPCRLVVITLPLTCKPLNSLLKLITISLQEGASDPSPNSGISEAIFANCAEVKMGGNNIYHSKIIKKPILAKKYPDANPKSIIRILNLSLKLQFYWLLFILIISILFIYI